MQTIFALIRNCYFRNDWQNVIIAIYHAINTRRDKTVADKKDFKTVEINSEAQEELEQQIRRHRHKIVRRVIIGIFAIALLFAGAQLWNALRSYDSYEIRNKTEQQDSGSAKYETFLGKTLEYNNDGIVYRNSDDELIWNQSFEMSTPMLSICENYLAIYDQGGTSIYIMTTTGLSKKIETSTPISTVCVANQGTVAVLMKEDNVSTVRMYDRKGNQLTNGEFYAEKGSFPVDIALSYDAQKLAVDMLDVKEGKVSSTISFYNFGSVGQNEIDNNVGTYTYEDTFISEISYVAADRMVALTDAGFLVFEGTQKPALKRQVDFEQEVQSVFCNNKYVGITYASTKNEGSWHIKVYDLNGNTAMENDTTIAYNRIEFLDNNEVCVRDDYHCEIYTIHSIRKFSYTFDQELYKILSGTDATSYTFVLSGETDEVRLR